jgi:hypothetical protein
MGGSLTMTHCPYCGGDYAGPRRPCPLCRQRTRWRQLCGSLRVGALGAALSTGAGIGAAAWMPALSMPLALGVLSGVLLFFLHRWKSAQVARLEHLRNQMHDTHALLALYGTPAASPLPWSQWALTPEAILDIVTELRRPGRDVVVECGSGLSTLVIAAHLAARGHGHVYAIEHDLEWHALVSTLLKEHGADRVATLVHAPLTPVDISGRRWCWYSLAALTQLEKLDRIGLLLVDGPPGSVAPLARYPALPYFWTKLDEQSLVVLDDGDRADERAIVARWSAEYPIAARLVRSGNGRWEIQRLPSDSPRRTS